MKSPPHPVVHHVNLVLLALDGLEPADGALWVAWVSSSSLCAAR